MKFMLRAGINAVVGGLLSRYSILIVAYFIDGFSRYLIPDLVLYSAFVLIILYLFNLLCNRIKYLSLPQNRSLWSVTLGILFFGLYFLYRLMFPDYSGYSGFLVELAVDIANSMFAIISLIMLVLSVILNIIIEKKKVEF